MQVTWVKGKAAIDFQPPRSNLKVKGQFNVFDFIIWCTFYEGIGKLLSNKIYSDLKVRPQGQGSNEPK